MPIRHYVYRAGLWQSEENGAVAVNKRHQIANFADFCNECGNCDVFCPDLGGPYVLKPRFFSSLEQWRQFSGHDGIYLADDGTHHRVYGRFEGREVFLEVDVAESGESTALPEALPVGRYRYGEVEVRLDPPRLLGDAPEGTTIDGTYIVLLDLLRRGVLFGAPVSYPALLARLSA